MGPFDGTYTSLWNDDLKPDNVDIYTYLEIFFPVWKTDGRGVKSAPPSAAQTLKLCVSSGITTAS